MDEQELLKKLTISLNALQGQVITDVLTLEEIKDLIITAERSTETIKNYYLSDKYLNLIDDLNFSLKALNHYFGIRKSINPVIENDNKLHVTLKNKIENIITTLNNFTNGTI